MPTIDRFDGIKINVYNGEHRPPHIHVLYNEFEALLTIETFEVYAGNLPARQMKKAIDWLAGNADWALDVFYELNPSLR
jgi:hypothetical protein